jgi:DNA-binding IclR family transcriptional regulator
LPARGKDSYSIQSVENALDVLEALCDEGDEVRISRLSERLGMNKTSVFRLLATFENRGYVEREADSGTYRLGLSAYEIGQKFLSRMGLLRKAKPVMERLVRECNETAYLAVRRERDVLFLDIVDTTQQVKIVSLVGRRYPLAATSAGKVILANTAGQDQGTRKQSSHEALAGELSTIREEGACLDRGVLGEGIASVAVPLFRAGGETPGSICFIGPDFRMSPEKIRQELLPRLKEAGEIISSNLGYLGKYLEK